MQVKQIIRQISSIIYTWDPLGGTPSDEYDDLAIELYKQIQRNKSVVDVRKFFEDYLKDYVGISDFDQQELNASLEKIFVAISKSHNH